MGPTEAEAVARALHRRNQEEWNAQRATLEARRHAATTHRPAEGFWLLSRQSERRAHDMLDLFDTVSLLCCRAMDLVMQGLRAEHESNLQALRNLPHDRAHDMRVRLPANTLGFPAVPAATPGTPTPLQRAVAQAIANEAMRQSPSETRPLLYRGAVRAGDTVYSSCNAFVEDASTGSFRGPQLQEIRHNMVSPVPTGQPSSLGPGIIGRGAPFEELFPNGLRHNRTRLPVPRPSPYSKARAKPKPKAKAAAMPAMLDEDEDDSSSMSTDTL